MLSSAVSMPVTTGSIHRSKSQPPAENRSSFVSPPSPPATHPMKNFFENILYLTPHRHISANTFTNRSKLSSSLSINVPSDRSSRTKIGHPSIISSISIHSITPYSSCESRVYLLVVFFCNFYSMFSLASTK